MKKLSLILILLFLILPIISHATMMGDPSGDTTPQTLDDPLGSGGEIGVVIARIISGLLAIIGAVAVALIVWGGFRYMISRGNQQEVEYAKTVITYAFVGLAVVATSYIIVQFLINALLNQG
ncbi:MAG: pilin [bacterium]